jgi:hypothetical protein
MDELNGRGPAAAAAVGRVEATDGSLESRLDEVERAAPGVAPIVAAAVRDGAPAAEDALVGVDDPMDVVIDQREAMARAVELRDDESLPADERARWSAAVEQLALARRQAKDALADRRRADPSEQSWMDAAFQAEVAAETADHDPANLEARGAPSAPGQHSGREEPAPWQPAHDRVGPESGPATTPSNPENTDQLTSGPGLAGGTGGQGSQNYPSDTGARTTTPDLVPDEDLEPPDIGHR